ncbi:MAG TPA: MBL fold metallo-hydrolase [Candidatus Acidoferrales bacterium]|nr:MBL fold metallo-hydrolase [Candidatus Acidoferrales bacterium]
MRSRRRALCTSSSLLLSWIALLALPSPGASACRDLDLARRFGALAYAAEADATIQYFGHNFFLITTRKGTRIVTDPLGPGMYPTPHIVGDIVTVGREHFNHNFVALVQGRPLVLRGLSHFGAEWNRVSMSYKDVFIYNVPIYHHAASQGGLKGAAFVFDLGTLCIAHLGDLSHTLSEEQVKQFGKVDVALTPIGGRFTMAPDVAREVLAQLKPKLAIPMHYRDNPYLVREFTAGIKTEIMKTDTLVVSKASLPSALEIKVLRPRGAFSYE